MRVSVVHPRDLGEPEVARWRALQAANPAFDNPFLSPEFTVTVGTLRGHVRVAVLEDGGQITGFFPFERHPFGIGKPVAAGLTDAQGMVYVKDLEFDPLRLLRACRLSVYEFDHLVGGQPLEDGKGDVHPSPIMDLSAGFDAYVATIKSTSSKTYKTTLAKGRKIERDFGPLHHDYGTVDAEPMSALLGWKTDQYRRTGRTDRFAQPWIVELVQRLLHIDTPDFGGVLDMLYVDGKPLAGHFGLRTATTLVGWFPAYDTAFAKYSPGLMHHLAMAERAAEAGIGVIDLGRGEKEYKDKLKTGEYTVSEGRLARAGAGAGVHWILRVPIRTARGTVLANPALFKAADHVLKTFGRMRTALKP
ncbi:Acetyltransferase involved in cellulose biosynthesis, CelD/BcsL family [Sinosporangium album]|uniref:Acetyltransferase involved in cellulose biosynthesis, CelD/BcsL family n=1 Tax=Sinosporangium album TaxID=504805 RepID=A0A1G8C234_9ACTN|nr:GNAT family N-acetyltransferase [Sinosporangium album]SDH39551.1 Acetyltransferase involved in cellulose biosynthesis, CelD/BcsL family [Sinosporangium album]